MPDETHRNVADQDELILGAVRAVTGKGGPDQTVMPASLHLATGSDYASLRIGDLKRGLCWLAPRPKVQAVRIDHVHPAIDIPKELRNAKNPGLVMLTKDNAKEVYAWLRKSALDLMKAHAAETQAKADSKVKATKAPEADAKPDASKRVAARPRPRSSTRGAVAVA